MGQHAFLIDNIFAEIPARLLVVPAIPGRIGQPLKNRVLLIGPTTILFAINGKLIP